MGGLPLGYSEKNVEAMFNQIMAAAGSMTPVVSVYLNHEKRFAFVEFSTPEEATKALALDNLRYAGSTLKVHAAARGLLALVPGTNSDCRPERSAHVRVASGIWPSRIYVQLLNPPHRTIQ